jgi:hypothetical protein
MSRAKGGWAVGLTATAALLLILAGAFEFFQGLAAVVNKSVFVATQETIYKFDVTAWGWIHLVIGLVAIGTGFGILVRAAWARVIGIVLAIVGSIANFLWIPYQPVWSIAIIVLYVSVIWALSVVGRVWDK